MAASGYSLVPVAVAATLLVLSSYVDAQAPFALDGSQTYSQPYDGHGALSAGASSRLLIDYDEPQRSQILDLLFKPNFGASMHLIKVEIGGDGQSTDGTEASHMHYRDDLSCKRGYEFWLLQEARKRNPAIKTYALSWASPYWVGNQTSFYSQDEIDYHIKWLQCTKEWDIGNIDYIGNWNERPWGPPDWTKQFKAAMVTANFPNTQIIIPDGGDVHGIEVTMDDDKEFEAAVAGIGVHYPCHSPQPALSATYNKKYWSSEDFSTVGNWDGAACWGRLLNQNFVRMNQTSTISWGLIWSVYETGFPYFGNGLMYAMTPWSGYFEAGQDGTDNGVAIWTNAHTCQFSQPGWKYLNTGHGAGSLTGGGSYVTLISPDNTHVTLVIEKLEGRCLRCAGQVTTSETVQFVLEGGLETVKTLQMWSTNLTHRFVQHDNIAVGAGGVFEVFVGNDSIVTVSSWFNGQTKGVLSIPIPTNVGFPLPYSDDFDSYTIDTEAKYFADNGGSFQIAQNPLGKGLVMKQWSRNENGVNRWGGNVNPITLIGNSSWSNITIAVSVMMEKSITPTPPPAPPPTPSKVYNLWQNKFNGQCLDVKGKATATGSEVDTWSCVSANNEFFNFEESTGHLVEQQTGFCAASSTYATCLPGFKLCIVPCKTDGSTSWTFMADGSLRPQHAPTQCLQVATKNLDSTVFIAACNTPLTAGETWTNTTTPPSPTPSAGAYGGVCVRSDRSGNGVCLKLSPNGDWTLGTQTGHVSTDPTTSYVRVGIKAIGDTITPIIDGVDQRSFNVNEVEGATSATGMVAMISGFNVAFFDNFTMS